MAKMTLPEAEKAVDSSVDKAKNHNLPPMGGVKLGIKRIAGDIIGGFAEARHAIGESWRGFRLRRVEKKENKAQSRLNKSLEWALRPRNIVIREERLKSSKVVSAQTKVDRILAKKQGIEDARRLSADQLVTGEVERSRDIDKARELLVHKKNEAMAEKWLLHKKKEMRSRGYTRREAQDVIDNIDREDRDKLVDELARGRAIDVAGALNERELSISKSQLDYIDKERKKIKDQLSVLEANKNRDIDELLNRGVGGISWALIDAAADALANGTPPDSFGAASLRQLGRDIHDTIAEINSLNAKDTLWVNRRRGISRKHNENEHNAEVARSVVEARAAAAVIRLDDLWGKIEGRDYRKKKGI